MRGRRRREGSKLFPVGERERERGEGGREREKDRNFVEKGKWREFGEEPVGPTTLRRAKKAVRDVGFGSRHRRTGILLFGILSTFYRQCDQCSPNWVFPCKHTSSSLSTIKYQPPFAPSLGVIPLVVCGVFAQTMAAAAARKNEKRRRLILPPYPTLPLSFPLLSLSLSPSLPRLPSSPLPDLSLRATDGASTSHAAAAFTDL